MSFLYGVLVTFARPETLRDTLARLAEQTCPLDRLLVVDNAPLEINAQSVAGYMEAGLDASYLPMEDNVGPAGGYAIGMQRALEELQGRGPSWVVLVDDDDPPRSSTILEQMARFGDAMALRDPAVGAVGAAGARFDLGRGRVDRPADEELTGPVHIDWIGNNILPFYSTEALREVGTMDPRLFFGFEELELGLRLRRAGHAMYANGPLMLEGRRASGFLGVSPQPQWTNRGTVWRRYYTIRNLIWTLRKNDSTAAAIRVTTTVGMMKPLVGLVLGPTNRIAFARMSFRACFDAWTGRLGCRVEPLRDDHTDVSKTSGSRLSW